MAAAQDGAHLAPLSQAMTELAEQLQAQKAVQQNILAVLNLLLDTNQAQTEMLSDILEAAQQEPEPSPVAQALEALVITVQQLADNQATLIAHVVELPEAIGRQFEIALRDQAGPKDS